MVAPWCTFVHLGAPRTHLNLLDEFLFVQEDDLDVEGLDDCPAPHLQASHQIS